MSRPGCAAYRLKCLRPGWDNVLYKGVNIPVPRLDVDVTDNGWLGPDPLETATPEWGREMLEAAAVWAVDFIGAFRKAEF